MAQQYDRAGPASDHALIEHALLEFASLARYFIEGSSIQPEHQQTAQNEQLMPLDTVGWYPEFPQARCHQRITLLKDYSIVRYIM